MTGNFFGDFGIECVTHFEFFEKDNLRTQAIAFGFGEKACNPLPIRDSEMKAGDGDLAHIDEEESVPRIPFVDFGEGLEKKSGRFFSGSNGYFPK